MSESDKEGVWEKKNPAEWLVQRGFWGLVVGVMPIALFAV
jgi:hypothetical protein